MQALYVLATKQISQLQNDLSRIQAIDAGTEEPSLISDPLDRPALNGQIVASLAALQRTVDDYASMAEQEMVPLKKEKALERVAKFKKDHSALRQTYDKVKKDHSVQVASVDRQHLLGSASSLSSSPSLASRRFPRTTHMPPAESPFTLPSRGTTPAHQREPSFMNRTNHALDEHSFIQNTSNTLDQYISHGQAILGNLQTQRELLKGTKRRLLNAANTLGLSRETIQFIEKRGRGDMAVLGIGAATTLVVFWFILRYLG